MNISVIGMGFVGLSMSLVFADKGHKVLGVDIDIDKLNHIRKKNATFFEPHVTYLLKKHFENNFNVTSSIEDALNTSDFLFVCVGTPSNPEDGSADLTAVKNVFHSIGKSLHSKSDGFQTVIMKSTVPPGTTSIMKEILEQESSKQVGSVFGLCMNPEFLKEGSAVNDMQNPHLVVIGTNDEFSKSHMSKFYESIYSDENIPVLHTSISNSEMIKYANNAFLATKISFINNIANLCNQIPHTDVEIIAKALGYDPRIGPLFLKAGPGYGGSCFPKDVRALINFSKSIGCKSSLIEDTHEVNQKQPLMILQLLKKRIPDLSDKTVSILGISFKKNTDDIREAVSLKIISELLNDQITINVHDPVALENLKQIFNDKINYFSDWKECLQNSDCCIILTEWDEYKNISANDFIKIMKTPIVVDARRILDPSKMNSIDFTAIGLTK